MTLKGILFDMDGTLCNTMPVVLQALQETFERYAGRTFTYAEIITMFGPSEEGVIMRRVPADLYPQALQHYLDRYAELHDGSGVLFPGVVPLMETLHARGIRCGVVTGKGRGTAEISMRAMGLDHFIDALETGSPEGAEKPVGIRKVLADWGMQPGEAAYAGDMPYDMFAAREAGVIPLGAAWAESATVSETDAALVFRSVDALREWVISR